MGEVEEDKSGKKRAFHFVLYLYMSRTIYNGLIIPLFTEC